MLDNFKHQATELFASNPEQRIFKLEYQGEYCWLKLADDARNGWRGRIAHRGQAIAARLLRLPLLLPPLARSADERLRHEAERLASLKSANWNVPEVLALEKNWLLLADHGVGLERLLGNALLPDRRELILAALAMLQRLHQNGEYHGAAQIRNFTRLNDGQLGMIDFEDDCSNMGLADRQVRDLFLFLLSVLRYDPSGDLLVPDIFNAIQRGSGSALYQLFTDYGVGVKKLTQPLASLLPHCGKDGQRLARLRRYL